MSERIFILLVGVCILISLYVEQAFIMYAIPAYLYFEGITDIRLTHLTQSARHVRLDDGLYLHKGKGRFNFSANRMWRLTVASILALSYLLLYGYEYELLWFFPWFLGFALTGAGVSGVCPGMYMIRYIGFK